MNSEWIALKRSLFYPKTDVTISNERCNQITHQKAILINSYYQHVKKLAETFFHKSDSFVVPLPTQGTFHLIYKVSFSEHERYIIKILLPELPIPSSGFLLDEWVSQLFASQALPYVKIYEVDLSCEKVPFMYEIMDFVPGQPLSLLQDPESQELPNGLLSSLGALIAQIHLIKIDGYGPLSIVSYKESKLVQGVHRYWSDYLFCHLKEHIEICTDIGAITFNEAEEVNRLFMKYGSLLNENQGVLLHGDLGGHNIFSDGGRITALIDWEDAMSGDPIFDLAYWGTFTRDQLRAELLSGYKKHAQLPEDFEIRYWLYYLRIALSKTVHRYRFGVPERAGRAAASTRIQKALLYLHNLGE